MSPGVISQFVKTTSRLSIQFRCADVPIREDRPEARILTIAALRAPIANKRSGYKHIHERILHAYPNI